MWFRMAKKLIIPGLILFSRTIFALLGCTISPKKIAKDENDRIVIAIKIMTSFPTITPEGRWVVIKDSFFVNYFKDLIVYKLPTEHVSANQIFDHDGNVIKEEIISRELLFKYFVYKKGEKKGLFFDSLYASKAKEIGSDSFVRKKFAINTKTFFTDKDSLLSQEVQENGDLLEKYVRIKKEGAWGSDTSFLTFSKEFKSIDFSFHKKLDSLKERKLVKARFVCLPDTLNPEPYFRNKREILISMEKIIVKDTSDILNLVKRTEIR